MQILKIESFSDMKTEVNVYDNKAKKNMCVYGPPTDPNFWPRP